MNIDTSIVDQYLAEESNTNYSNHWVFSEIEKGKNVFTEPDNFRATEVLNCQNHIIETCSHFIFRNNDLVHKIFDDVPKILKQANILLTVGMPSMYDAMVREYQGKFYMIFDLINFANYVVEGIDLSNIIEQLLTHELIHMLIFEAYPSVDEFDYMDYLNYISFHEGFAHLLAYKEDITNYQPDEKVYKPRFDTAKEKLLNALNEKDPTLRQRYKFELNAGDYWSKFGAIASKLYLMKHMNMLERIYNEGWENYISKIVNYYWS